MLVNFFVLYFVAYVFVEIKDNFYFMGRIFSFFNKEEKKLVSVLSLVKKWEIDTKEYDKFVSFTYEDIVVIANSNTHWQLFLVVSDARILKYEYFTSYNPLSVLVSGLTHNFIKREKADLGRNLLGKQKMHNRDSIYAVPSVKKLLVKSKLNSL